MVTDCEFLLRVLSDGEPHSLNEVLRRSFAERGCGLTVHSRAADLRRQGHLVANWKDGERGDGSWYRLLNEPDGREVGPRRSGSLSGQPASPLAASFPAPGDDDGNQLAAQQQIDGQLTLTGSEFRRSAA
jgi:hypothetical protein